MNLLKMLRRHWRAFMLGAAILSAPSAARADPISSSIVIALNLSGWAAAAVMITGRILVSVGLSMLSQALQKKQTATASGVKTTTSTGGSTAQTFILGKYATGGHLPAPLMSYDADGGTPNAYLVYVVALGCKRGQTLSRLILNDNYVDIDTSLTAIGGATTTGYKILGDYDGNAWIRVHDGSQTTADALLVEKLSAYPDRPWSSFMVGTGIPYAVLVFKYNDKIFSGEPQVRFECNGIPLYDPRYDDTVGGSGAQRWDDQTTWAPSENLVVMIYNIHRGIPMEDGSIWGGETPAEDLPLDNWFTAMNACDASIDLSGGGAEPAYTGGLEVSLSDQPADVMEALETACCAQQVEIGGVWKIRVGGPGLPVLAMTDDDILVDHDQNHDMFPSLDDTHNGIQGTHPLPSALWENSDAPARYNATWEGEDDDRRLVADLTAAACWSPTQMQRIMQASIEEERRFRRHSLSLGPYASMVEVLDSVAWTSDAEGYTDKVFEISQASQNLRSIVTQFSLRERDSNDFAWSTSDELPWVAALPGTGLPVAQAVPGWAVTPTTIKDATGAGRRPALALTWTGDLPDVTAIMWQIRVEATGVDVASGTASNVAAGGIVVSEGLLPATGYQARAQLVTDRPTDWTAWISATTPDVRLSADDLSDDIVNSINSTALDTIKLYSLYATYKQITDSLLYVGDGRSVQLVSVQAENKSDTALNTLNLIGALNGDSSAYVLNTSFVQVGGGQTLAGFVTTVNSTIDDLSSSVTEQATAIDGLTANYQLKVQAGKYIAGVYANADDATGTSDVGFFATKFFLADLSDPDHPIQVFGYSGGVFSLHGDVQIDGSLNIINGSITTDGLALGTVTNTNFSALTTGATIDTSTTHTIVSADLTTHGGTSVEISAILNFDALHGSTFYVDIYRDATLLHTIPEVQMLNVRSSWPFGYVDTSPAAGDHTYSIQMRVQTGADTDVGFLYRYLKVTEFKR